MSFLEIERISDPITARVQRILQDTGSQAPHYLIQLAQDSSWTSLGGEASLEAARTMIHLSNQHVSEIAALARIVERPRGKGSPWGMVQTETTYAAGVVRVTTAEHGGFLLTPEANTRVPEALRNPNGVYEEDGEWAKVAFAYPELFTAYERVDAQRTLRNAEPDAYTALTGEVIPIEESYVLRERAFYALNAQRYIGLTSRLIDAQTIEVTAVIGGARARQAGIAGPAKRFRVNSAEYAHHRGFGFVIDSSRHAEIID